MWPPWWWPRPPSTGWVGPPPAGLESEVLEPGTMLPQVGQGALAVECREEDADAPGAGRHRRPRRAGAWSGRAGLPGRAGRRVHPAGGCPRRAGRPTGRRGRAGAAITLTACWPRPTAWSSSGTGAPGTVPTSSAGPWPGTSSTSAGGHDLGEWARPRTVARDGRRGGRMSVVAGRRGARRPGSADPARRRAAAAGPTWSSTTGSSAMSCWSWRPRVPSSSTWARAPAVGPPVRDQRPAHRARPVGPQGGPAQGRRSVRVRAGRGGGRGAARLPGSTTRWCPGSAPPSPHRRPPASRSPTGAWPRR